MLRHASRIGSTIASEPFLIDKETADILLERAALAGGNEQPERLHQATDLV